MSRDFCVSGEVREVRRIIALVAVKFTVPETAPHLGYLRTSQAICTGGGANRANKANVPHSNLSLAQGSSTFRLGLFNQRAHDTIVHHLISRLRNLKLQLRISKLGLPEDFNYRSLQLQLGPIPSARTELDHNRHTHHVYLCKTSPYARLQSQFPMVVFVL